MFKNKTSDGRNNLCGRNVMKFRKELNISQRGLASKLQMMGYDIDKNAIQRIESGERFVTDIEIVALTKALGRDITELIPLQF